MEIFNFGLNNKHWISRGFILLLAIFILFGLSYFELNKESRLEVNFFDVGQGDAILVKTPLHQKILIDGGPNNTIMNKLGKNLPFYDKEIDLMILTHPHADHLTGLIEVLKRYKVKKILATGVLHTTSEYLSWLEEIKKQNIPMQIAKASQIIDLSGGIKIEILHPLEDLSGKRVRDLNNSSIVFKLTFNKNSFLFTGDAELEVEKKLINSNFDLKADVLKLAHHGSKNATSQAFLDKVLPQIAVISVGKNNFGQPSQSVINRLKRIGTHVFRTDKNGDIKVLSDGNKIWVENSNISNL
jgi:competence protein ComEC